MIAALALWLALAGAAERPGEAPLATTAEGNEIVLRLALPEGWHVQSNAPADKDMIATRVEITDTGGARLDTIIYPAAKAWRSEFSHEPLSVFSGDVKIRVRLAGAGGCTVAGTLIYQACDDLSCFPPVGRRFSAHLDLRPEFSPPPVASSAPAPAAAPTAAGWNLAHLLALFLLGIGLNLTPCVYPLIPVTVGFFGARALPGRETAAPARSILPLLVYALTLAFTFALVGLLAAATGSFFGSLLTWPPALVFVSLVFCFLALWSAGVFEVPLPSWGGRARGGAWGALLMGATAGLVAAPCVGPVLAGLFLEVATSRDFVFGFFGFGAVGLGMATPLALLGFFSGAVTRLPKPGPWMLWVKRFFALLLLLAAVYPLVPLIGLARARWLAALVLAGGGLWLGVLDRTAGGKVFRMARQVIGVLSVALGLWLIPHGEAATAPRLAFTPFSLAAFAAAPGPQVVDASADWCVPCLELDLTTFRDPRVVAAAAGMSCRRFDLTREVRGDTEAWRRAHDIAGVPTILFFLAPDHEVRALRLTGYEPPDSFAARLMEFRKLAGM